MNDEKIVRSQHRFRSGNGSTLTKRELADIYDQHYLPIYRFIFRQVGNVEVSRELTSEVFHRMLKYNQNEENYIQSIVPWLYCVARNLVVDYYRRQQYRDYLPLNDEIIESSYNTAEAAENRISAEKMRLALQKLTPDQRQVILLKFVEGFSNQEVADALSKPIGAVKSLQHRALVALRHLLDSSEERIIV